MTAIEFIRQRPTGAGTVTLSPRIEAAASEAPAIGVAAVEVAASEVAASDVPASEGEARR